MNSASSICLPVENALFNFRVAGVAVQNGKLLLHRTPTDNFWSLPGGRVDMFEFSSEALLREMLEEIGRKVIVGKLLWVVENFFGYNNIKHHEIGFYYQMEIPDLQDQHDFVVQEDDTQLLFHWEDVENIDSGSIYPEFITADLLLNTSSIRHITLDFKNLNDSQVKMTNIGGS
ncbi:ADP-ribose pyrophosphatase YjhB, NUDIX family [Dyadobacter koreensis]|uniref:ADP-ribose pyrophosphatase YjhB, NUDIX family n=1 Tax=Dyadobacter koreensis TaxID=408657 RepID=A0A1H6RD36_9BACT|nr:NUDIX hydrolase [Dyadobacter koreensis]SEI53653.1 ADP-ribose pyrophosphatase YjhB, NUDIX family [Dyadobacter koreensis]